MATQVKRRRGTNAESEVFIGAEGEFTYDMDKKRISAHDGVQIGGFPHPNYLDIIKSSFNAADAILSAGVYNVTLKNTPDNYAEFFNIWTKPDANNVGDVDIDVNSLGLRDIKKDDGSGVLVELGADDLKANMPVQLVYDGVQFIAQLGGGSAGGAITQQIFSASGTWNKPSGITKAEVTVIGGGGGARWSAGTATAGGTSSFGSHLSATGGAASNSMNVFKAGGIGAGGDFNLGGGDGVVVTATNPSTVSIRGGNPITCNTKVSYAGAYTPQIYGEGAGHNQGHAGNGGIAIKLFDANDLAASETVTVGAGGGPGLNGISGSAGAVIVREFY